MIISSSIEIAIYGHRFEFDFSAEVSFDLDHEHSEDGWYVDDNITVDTRGWSIRNVEYTAFDQTIIPEVLREVRENIDEIMVSSNIRRAHGDEIRREIELGYKRFEVLS